MISMAFNGRKNEALLMQKYLTGSMTLLTVNHSFMTCGGPEAFTSTTIFEKGGGKTSSVGQEHYILKTHSACGML